MLRHMLCLASLLAIAGCAGNNLPNIGPLSARHSPANPNAPAPGSGYVPVTAGYSHFSPVEPRDWREMNRRVAPPAAPAQGGSGHAH